GSLPRVVVEADGPAGALPRHERAPVANDPRPPRKETEAVPLEPPRIGGGPGVLRSLDHGLPLPAQERVDGLAQDGPDRASARRSFLDRRGEGVATDTPEGAAQVEGAPVDRLGFRGEDVDAPRGGPVRGGRRLPRRKEGEAAGAGSEVQEEGVTSGEFHA